MKVNEIMTRDVEVATPKDSVQGTAKKMRDHDIGFLPIYEGDQLIGVLTDRDLTLRALANGTSPQAILGRSLVTSPAVFCYEDQNVEDAARLMQYNQIRRLVVLDRRDHLAGVISMGDLAGIVDDKVSGKILQNVSAKVRSV